MGRNWGGGEGVRFAQRKFMRVPMGSAEDTIQVSNADDSRP